MVSEVFRAVKRHLLFGISMLVIGCFLTEWCVIQHKFLLGLFSVFLIIYGIVLIIIHSRRNVRKLGFLIDAIANNDFSMKFSGRFLTTEEQTVNESLNKISDILRLEKINTAQREQYYSIIINSVKTGIVAIDDRGYVVQTNDEALRILGLTVFTHIRQLNRIDIQLESMLNSILTNERRHISFTNGNRETHLIVRVSNTTLHGKSVRILALDDIHNEMNEKEIDSWIKLTRVLTHEIMNSIAPITSLSNTLLNDKEQQLTSRTREGLNVISNTSQGLMTFVESFRKFTALPQPIPTLVYVNDLINDVVQLAKQDSDIQIELNIRPKDLIIYADRHLIRQVLTNIVKNASQAITESGKGNCINIQAQTEGDTVIIEISNNGPVIPGNCIEQIFVPFFTTKDKGNGIGLSVSRQIMRLSGGNIMLRRSPEKEFATTFVLIFN